MRDEVEQQPHVVGLMAHVRLEAADGAAEAQEHVRVRGPAARVRPGAVGERGERDRPGGPRRRVVAREREQHLVRLQILAVKPGDARPRRVLVLLGDDHVEATRREQRQGLLALALHELDPQPGVRVLEAIENR